MSKTCHTIKGKSYKFTLPITRAEAMRFIKSGEKARTLPTKNQGQMGVAIHKESINRMNKQAPATDFDVRFSALNAASQTPEEIKHEAIITLARYNRLSASEEKGDPAPWLDTHK